MAARVGAIGAVANGPGATGPGSRGAPGKSCVTAA